jgi:NADH:ubiquinone oxidoreductase subunit
MKNLVAKIFGFFTAKSVGRDEFGNSYYESYNSTREFGRKRRGVMYNGIDEASKVPANWFLWLHYQSDSIPKTNDKAFNREVKHYPNLTGTTHAYYPAGHIMSGKRARDKATGDYQGWKPIKE